MNRIYKVIFNTSLGLYQVVSEIARNHGKSSSGAKTGRKSVMVPFIVAALLALPVGTGALAADTNTSTNTQTNTTVTVNSGDQLKGTGAAAVSSATTTDGSTKTITIDVPKDGKVEPGNTGLVTGGKVYSEVRPATDGTYVKPSQTTAQNLTNLDTQVGTNTGDITKLKDLSNLTEKGQKVIQTASQNAVKVAAGTNIKVDSSTADDGSKTYTVSAEATGKVAKDDTGLVSGDIVNTAITDAVNSASTAAETAVDTKLLKKADVDAGNIGKNLKNADGSAATDEGVTANEKAWGTAIGTGNIATPSGMLITDTAVHDELRPAADGTYVKAAQTTAQNLTALDTQVGTNTSDITKLKDLSNISDAGNTAIKKQAKQAVKVAADGNASVTTTGNANDGNTLTYTIHISSNGTVTSNNTGLISGGTLYSELRPANDGTYVKTANTTAVNLLALDTNLANVINAMGLDINDTKTSYTSKLNKYFKVNPDFTTNSDDTKTYAPDAAANGTNSVAIGPNAKTAQYTTTTTSGNTTTTTETAADHAVAIGDGATVNAAGDKGLAIGNGASVGEAESTTTSGTTTTTTDAKGGESSAAIGDSAKANGNTSIALGANAQVLNTTDYDGKTTATIEGSTAIGSGAKVNGASDAAAIGTKAQVNETATGGIAFGKGAVTGEDKGTVTVDDVTANVAAVGGENSVALGTDAKASGDTALALGNGAQVNNYTTQSGTTVTKTVSSGSTAIGSGAVVTGADDAVALGTGAKVTGTGDDADDSMAIGKGASVVTAKDAMALGTSAAVASGATNAVAIGNTAKANTSNTTAIGYNASATGAGAIAIGENTSTSTEGGISIGSGTSVSGKSIVIGYATDANGNTVKTESQNTDAVAIGNGAQANANDSISIGHQAGKDTNEGRTSGYGSLIAIGTNAGGNVKGMQNVALGSGAGSNVKSSYNVAIGSNAGSGINYAAAADSNPQDGYNISIGYEANYQSADANAKNIKESIAIGHSANAVSEATALGTGAAASGDKSMALGYNAAAADTDSIALGDKASAAGGNIAIGSGSQAPVVASYDKGYRTGSTSVNGYISVGGKTSATGTTVLRRISNVADGAADQDAVTVAQLKAAYNDLEGTIKTTDTKISDTYTQSAIDSKISTVESKITASQTKYFSINPSSDTLTANANNDGASTTGAADAMAIGPNATATSAKAVAIGNNVSASGKGSIALGTADNPATTGTVDAGSNTSANPHVTSAEGANSVAIGTSAIAQTDNSVALGTRASVYTSNVTDPATNTTVKVGQKSIAIGYESETRNSNATSIGSGAKAYNDGSTAIGHSAYAQGADSVVIGTSSTANGASSGIVGKSNTVNGSNTYTVGSENNVNGNWGAVTYSGFYGSKNVVNPVSDKSGNTKHGMASLSVTGNSNTISQGSYSDTVQNISILGNGNSVTGAKTDEANAGTTANITIIGGDNKVTGRDGAGSDYMGKTWNQLTRTTVIGYKNTVNQAASTTSLADTQILGNDVTATLGNSVYLGTGAAAKTANLADATTLTDAEQAAVDALDTTGMTDTEKATAQANAKAAARYATNLKTMKQSGTTAGLQSLSTDTTYDDGTSDDGTSDDGTSYTYAGSSPAGVVTVGTVGSERRIQNVAAGLVSATSTDAVNGSQLYALTRQLRFGGDNSSFGTTTADDKNVVARGSNETLNIIGGEKDATKLTDNNIGVMADSTNNSLSVKLASDLKKLNTASLGSGSGDSYKETIKLDGTGTNGGQITLADAAGTVKTTLDTTGLTIADGPKFTSSGIDAASQKITSVKAGEADTDAANVGQVKSARTLLTQGTNTKLDDKEADGHHTYTVNVDNLAVKANGAGTTVALGNGINFKNGTNTTSSVDANGNVTIDTKNLTLKANGETPAAVTMDGGINFKNGTNTTAAVGTDGTVTINATHNKLNATGAVTKATADSNAVTLTLQDADGNTTTAGLTDTYTTVSKNTDHTITFKRNDGSEPVSISLDNLNGASKEALTTAAAKATTTVIKGSNVDSVEDDTTSADGHHIYKVNVSNLGVKVADGQKKSVALSDGLVFGNGTNTTASVGDNGAITFNVSNDAIKTQAKDAINMSAGSNVKVETATSTDGLSKTFTISATHNALKSATLTPKSNDVSTLTITGKDGDGASVDIKNTHLTVSKDSTAKTVTFTSNDGITPETTLSLSDFGAASTTDMTTAVAKATTEVRAGANASLGTVETDTTDQHKIYTVNVDNLGVSQNGTKVGTGVSLKNGLNFTNGTNTIASVAENGTVSYSVSNDAIKAQAKDAVVVQAGDNVSIDTPTDANNVKTYTVRVNDLKLQANGEDKGTRKLAEGINFANGKNITAAVEDGKVVYSLNDALTDLTSVTARDTAGNQTLVSGSGVTITPAAAGTQPISLTTNGLSMGNQQITNVQSGGDTDTNAANISDVKRLVKESASGTTETGFNVKGDDATAKKVKLGKQLNVVGGTTDSTQLSTGNIGVETTADAEGNATLTVKLKKDIALDSVTTGSTTLNTSGVTNGNMSLTATGMTITNTDASKQVSVTTSGVSMGSQRIQNVADAVQDTDAATLNQVKNARTKVIAGDNVSGVTSSEATDGSHQMTYTVNVDNLSVKANNEAAKSVTLKNGLTFNNGTNTTASVGDNGEVKYDLNPALTGLTSVTAGNSTLDTNGLTIKEGTATKVAITSDNVTMGGNVIHNVGAGQVGTDAVNKDQLDALQTQVNGGWNLAGNNAEGTAVTAKIGAGKTVTYGDGNYTKFVVTKDDSTGNATVKVDVTTGTFGSGTGDKAGTVTAKADGLATTEAVANAINSAYWTIQDGNNPDNAQQVKAGDNTVSLKAGDNLSLDQNGKEFTYKLNKTLQNMTSVTAVDDKKNTAVLNGEGLKVSDEEGDSLTQHATEIRLHDGTKAATDTATDVVLNNQGLQNGGHKITGVADGTIGEKSQDAINGSQFYKLQQSVTNGGWNITGEDTNNSTHIGNDKTVSFKNGAKTTVEVIGSDTGAVVKVNVNTTAISTDVDHKAAASGNGLATASDVASAINNAAWNVKKNGETAQQVKAGDTVTFDAGDNIVLNQSGTNFTYGLASDVNINSIRLGGTKDGKGNWAGGIYIGEQAGSGANLAKGFYITGLSNTKWDRATISENSSMAATEGQLKQAIENITKSGDGTGGFGLTADSGEAIMQDLRKTIQVKGDGEGTADGNITTSNESGVLHIRLNKKLDLTDQGSVTIGSSKVSDGSIVLGNTDVNKKIALNSNEGTASIGGVTVNGTAKTVSGLSNTEWNVETAAANGYKGSNKAATESQLQTVYDQATKTASENELHTLVKDGGYTVDDNHKVSMDVVNGKGDTQGSIVINDVAKASEVGTVSEIADDLKKKNGDTVQPTSVVEAINNLNDKVGDKKYSTVQGKEITDGDNTTTAIGKLNNRMNDIYQTAGQHTTVSNTDKNLDIKPTTDDKGKTNYEINLSKQVNLGDVKLDGEKGSIEAKSIKSDSFTAGNTVVNNDGLKVGDKSALTEDSLKVGGDTYVDKDGINANNKAIHHVGEGKEDGDAVNVKQVNELAARQGAAITENAAHINQLGQAVNKLDNRINRVGAGAAALAALHPGDYDPDDKLDVSAGVGNYRGANAAAVGLFFHPNERTILSVAGSMGGGENMVNAGVTLKVGPGHGTPTTVTTKMGQKVDVMDILAKQTEILEKLAGNTKAASAPAGSDIFPDVPQNHWAYAYVDKLYRAGSLAGFSEPGKLKSHMLTRKDFAEILYWAMTNGATTNPELNGDGSLNRLAAEFGAELKLVMK